ncbi:unnamed protein product [Polarella glacialis]|uniref:Uncharacterized protein n=1 Tax=Polarella glacialis TaxID=89957 RepID=A0A813IN51_POLGL|nr:unnamed protein product [Polarella glacialis]
MSGFSPPMTDSSGLVLSLSSSSVRSSDRHRRSRPRVTATPAAASSSLALKRDAPDTPDSFGSSNTSSAGISDIAAAESGTPVFNLTRIDVHNTTQQQTLQQQQVLIQQTVLIQEDPRFAEVALQAHQAVADEKALLAAQAQAMVDAERNRIAQLAHEMMVEQQRNNQEVALQNNARLTAEALEAISLQRAELLLQAQEAASSERKTLEAAAAAARKDLTLQAQAEIWSRDQILADQTQQLRAAESSVAELQAKAASDQGAVLRRVGELEAELARAHGGCSGVKPLLPARGLSQRAASTAPLLLSQLRMQHALRLRAAPLTRSWVFSMDWRAGSPRLRRARVPRPAKTVVPQRGNPLTQRVSQARPGSRHLQHRAVLP